jgi:hypothetical protein
MSKIPQKTPEENNYERFKAEGDAVKRKEFEQRIKDGELKWAFCAIDNDKLYHYYLKVKKKK